jgi:hypothetical protein
MRGTDSSTPAAGRGRRSKRPGFSYEIRLVGGEAGRRLERQQAEAVAEVLRWLAANPQPGRGGAEGIPQAGRGSPGPANLPSSAPQVGWPYGLEVRARAVGLVGVGRPVGEVARLVGVHPGTVHRWVRQAARRWADPADAAAGEDGEQPTDQDPSAG